MVQTPVVIIINTNVLCILHLSKTAKQKLEMETGENFHDSLRSKLS